MNTPILGAMLAVSAIELAGRSFDARDAGDLTNPVIVDRSFVRAFLNGEFPVGRRFRYAAGAGRQEPSSWYEIVGVTENLATNLIDPDAVPPYVFYPVAAEQVSAASLRLHMRGSAALRLESGLPKRLHRLAAAVDPALRLGAIRPSAVIDLQGALRMRLFVTTLTLVMVTVLLLSAAGVYALMSFAVAQRRWIELTDRHRDRPRTAPQMLRTAGSRSAPCDRAQSRHSRDCREVADTTEIGGRWRSRSPSAACCRRSGPPGGPP